MGFEAMIKHRKILLRKLEKTRSSHPEVFPEKGVLKIYYRFIGKHQCQRAISIKLLRNFTEITLQHVCPPVNLLHIFRTPFLKNTSGWLLLENELYKHLTKSFLQALY